MAKTHKSLDTTQKKGTSKKKLGVAPKVKTVKRQHKLSQSAKASVPPKTKLTSKPKPPSKSKTVSKIKKTPKVNLPAIETSSNILPSEPQVVMNKRKRTKINLETYIEKITQAVKKCDAEIEKLSLNPSGERKGIKT